MSGIDPLRMAQFMVLPGAAELVEAFASIPPGALRDSIVHHAQALAAQYDGPPAPGWANVRPARVGSSSTAPPRLPSPFAENLTAKSPEGQVVERALRGEPPGAIAADMGLTVGAVVAIMHTARREGGVSFPGDAEGKPAKAKGYKVSRPQVRIPLPPAPWWWEEDDHPNWDSPAALPHLVNTDQRSRALIGPMDRRTYATMLRTAERQGVTLKAYVRQRQAIVARVTGGETPRSVADDLRLQGTFIYSLLRAIGEARVEGVNSGAQAPHPLAPARPQPVQAAKPPEAASEPLAAAPEPEDAPDWPVQPTTRGALAAKLKAVAKWGFETEHAYDAARIRVRELLRRGWTHQQAAEAIGQPVEFVKNAWDYWQRVGHPATVRPAVVHVGEARHVRAG